MQRQVTRVLVATTTVVVAIGVVAVPSSLAARGSGPRTSPLVGTIQRLHLDAFGVPTTAAAKSADSDEVALLRTPQGSVRLNGAAVDGIADGTTVRANLITDDASRLVNQPLTGLAAVDPTAGASVSGVDVLSPPRPDVVSNVTTASAAATIPTQHEVTVVLATWAGLPRDSMSSASLAALVDGSVSSYWATVTHDQISFHTTARYGWITTSTHACSGGDAGTNSFNFWNEVKSKVGFVEAPGRHLVVYFPRTSECGGSAGLATVGSGADSGGLSWTNGYPIRGVVGHELGHNLSLGHSDELRCTSSGRTLVDSSIGSCVKRGYWDLGDIMGISWNNQGYLSAAHQERLGVLPDGASLTLSSSTRVELSPVAGNTGLRAVQFTTAGATYVVEYRGAVGLDSWLSTAPGWGDPGVTVHRVFDYSSMSSSDAARLPSRDTYLLDGNPATNDDDLGQMKTVLPNGSWVSFAGAHGGVRVASIGGGHAYVDIDVNGSLSRGSRGTSSASHAFASLTRGSVAMVHGAAVAPAVLSWNLVGAQSSINVNAATVAAGSRSAVTGLSTGWGRWRENRWTVIGTNSSGRQVKTVAKAYGSVLNDSRRAGSRFHGRWLSVRDRSAIGKREHTTKHRGASVSIRVKARGFGIIATKTKFRGRMKVYINGHFRGTIDLWSSRARTRQVVWTRMFSTSRWRTIKLVCMGTHGRAKVGVDGFVLLT